MTYTLISPVTRKTRFKYTITVTGVLRDLRGKRLVATLKDDALEICQDGKRGKRVAGLAKIYKWMIDEGLTV